MREKFNHYCDPKGEILIADPNSQKGKWGTHHPEAYEPDDPRFLEQVSIDNGKGRTSEAYVVGPPCPPVTVTSQGVEIGADMVAVEEKQHGGGFTEILVHASRIIKG